MIHLTINSEQFDYHPVAPMSWVQMLDDISNKFLEDEQTIIEVKLNNHLLDRPHSEQPLEILQDLQKIELEVMSKQQLAQEMLLASKDHLEMTQELLQLSVIGHRQNRNQEAETHFIRLVDALEVFTHSIEYVQQVMLQKIHESEGLRELLTESEEKLLTLLQNILKAKEKKDMVLLADLLEYELTSALTCWRLSIIPKLMGCV